jgi:hypothetical protein
MKGEGKASRAEFRLSSRGRIGWQQARFSLGKEQGSVQTAWRRIGSFRARARKRVAWVSYAG